MYDLIIVGMGPAGMSAAVYASRANLNVLILESNSPGGALLKAKNIDNYLGFSNVEGSTLALEMFNHINSLKVNYKIESVLKINNNDDYKEIITNKNSYKTKTILITSGKTVNKLIINNNAIKASNISYCALCDGSLYKDKDVVLIKEHELEDNEEIYLKNIVNKLIVINKKNIKDIIIDNNMVVEIVTNDKNIKVSGVFVSADDNIIPEYDKELNIRENGKIVVNSKYETKVRGIYAAGDVIKKELYQVCTAVSDGAEATVNIIEYLGSEL